MPAPPWSLVYADGSANLFRFEATADGVRFVYEPMTPERSSSGMYSGGDPRDERIDTTDRRLVDLLRIVTDLERDRAHHADARCKGDGAVTITIAGETRDFLVVRAATRDLEALLATFTRT
jgi:hypothetical protein